MGEYLKEKKEKLVEINSAVENDWAKCQNSLSIRQHEKKEWEKSKYKVLSPHLRGKIILKE